MAVIGVWVGYAVFRAAVRLLPRRSGMIPIAAGVGGLASVPASAGVFALLFSIGGAAPISLSTLLAAMVGVHTVIGVGEAVITGLVVASVLALRPDLVRGAAGLHVARPLEIRTEARV